MNDFDLEKWNLRFCPKCRGHIQIGQTKRPTEVISVVKYCQNYPNCDYKIILSKDNITDNDRHRIIESHFGYNKAFDTNKDDFYILIRDKLLFENELDFFNWYVPELTKYKSLDHNTLPVSSPYWTIIKKLGQFLSDAFEIELKQVVNLNLTNLGTDEKRNLSVNSGFDIKILWN